MAHPRTRGTVFLHGRDGSTQVFPSREKALATLGFSFIERRVRAQFRVPCSPRYGRYDAEWNYHPVVLYALADYILRDERGQPLTAADFAGLVPARSTWWSRRWDSYRWNGEGPVPGTRKCSGHYCWFRHPRTANERRLNALVLAEDGEIGPRAARRPARIPTAWDDLGRHVERNWKRQRKTQWRSPS